MEKIALQNHPCWNFCAKNNRCSIPIGISIEIFIPKYLEIKFHRGTKTGVLVTNDLLQEVTVNVYPWLVHSMNLTPWLS